MKLTTGIIFLALFVLLAGLPSYAASPYSGNAAWAARWLSQNQNIDGSWGATDDVKLPCTAEAVMALRALNQRASAYYWGITWLENHNAPNVDYAARRILALSPHGDNVSVDLAYIQNAQTLTAPGNKGWGATKEYQGIPLDSSMALLACSQMGATANVQAALDYIKAAQLTGTDKGWVVAQEAASDALTTALVVQTLVNYKSMDVSLVTNIANGISSLAENVGTGAPIHLQALAAITHLRAGYANYATPLLNYMAAVQTSDGSWSQDPYATALAARAMAAAMQSDLADLSDIVYVPDPNLRKAINEALGKNSMDNLTKGDMANLTTLSAAGRGISNLTGLEWAKNLTSADLRNNAINDISPLNGLPLTTALLDGNPVYAGMPVPAISLPGLILACMLLMLVNAIYSHRKRGCPV